MNTTEWVERYNRAFLRAGAPDEVILESTPCVDWTEEDHRAYNLMPPLMEAAQSNPSPFEPKEVVDDTPAEQNPVKPKEPTITVYNSRMQECQMGREEYEGLKKMGMLWEFYPEAPEYWPL